MDIVSVVVVIAVLGILSVDAFAEEVYRPIGRAVLSRLSRGRIPGVSSSWLARFAIALTGLAVLLVGVVLLLWLVTAVTE